MSTTHGPRYDAMTTSLLVLCFYLCIGRLDLTLLLVLAAVLVIVHSTLPCPPLPNPVTSLYRAAFWQHCHSKHGGHVHRKAYAWLRARGRMYMHMHGRCTAIHVHVHCPSVCCDRYEMTVKTMFHTCMYVCMNA